jgi:hypothetical protein
LYTADLFKVVGGIWAITALWVVIGLAVVCDQVVRGKKESCLVIAE